jgi:transposase InsO family protein
LALVVAHHRRKVLHFNVTDSPSAGWTAQQLVEAFPYGTPPRYLLRDRDSIYGKAFVRRVKGLGLEQKLSAPRCPWQNPVIELGLSNHLNRERLSKCRCSTACTIATAGKPLEVDS